MLKNLKPHFKNQGASKAQIFSEYAILIAIVAASLIAMSLMVKRAVQGRLKDAKDRMMTEVDSVYRSYHGVTEQTPENVGSDYEPYYANTESEVTRYSKDRTQLLLGATTGIARMNFDETTSAQTNSFQLPPGYAP